MEKLAAQLTAMRCRHKTRINQARLNSYCPAFPRRLLPCLLPSLLCTPMASD